MNKQRITTRSAAPAVSPDGFIPGSTMDRRAAPETLARFALGSYDSESRTVEAVFSTGSRVRRWGIFEELAITPEAIDLARVSAGQVRLLDSHSQDSIDDILGTVESARIEGDQLIGRIRFAASEAGRNAEAMVAAGDVGGISIGYRVTTWSIAQIENDIEVWRADRWELLEVSLVAVPADAAGMVRQITSPQQVQPSQPETEIDDMRRNTSAGDPPVPVTAPTSVGLVIESRAAPVPPPLPTPPGPPQVDLAAERARSLEIATLARSNNIPAEVADTAIRDGITVDQFRARAFDALVARQVPASHVRVERDETETRRAAMEEALTVRLAGAGEPSAAARAYMGHRLYELAAESIGHHARITTKAAAEDVVRRAFHATSDFPIIFENAINRTLVARYTAAAPTDRRLARQRSYADFRPHIRVRPGDFPALQLVNPEGGEIRSATFSESKEATSVQAYGVRVNISRRMLVDDTLNAIQDVLADQSTAVAMFEDDTFYAMMLSASGAGPTLQETSRAVFNTTDATLAASAAAITVASVSLGRAALRKRTSRDGRKLNLAPRIMLVGPDKETEAQQLLAPVQAQQASNVNPFSGSLSVEVTAQITGNAWYMLADPSVAPVFEWGLLEGYTAPRMRMDEPFGMQGISVSLEHDFGCGAIDFRGAYRNPGA